MAFNGQVSVARLCLATVLLATIIGCGELNDNPTDANKMSEIRHKEAAGRSGFNPDMSSPPRK